jgi:hypothetical protein
LIPRRAHPISRALRPAVALSLLLVLCADAGAGRRRFAWLWDTEVLVQRGVELEWWIWEVSDEAERVSLLVATVIGLTDRVELGVPVTIVSRPETGVEIESYGLDARWRLVSADPVRAGPLVPVLRAGARRQIPADALRLEGGLTLSLDAGRARAVVDGGVVYRSDTGDVRAVYGAGVSFALTEDLAAGVEAYGVARLTDGADAWISLGPNVAFTWGRFWLAASLPFGLHDDAPDVLPRVIWATAF